MTRQGNDGALDQHQGIDRIIAQYRRKFRVPENLDHYSEADFHEAERRYLHFCLTHGNC